MGYKKIQNEKEIREIFQKSSELTKHFSCINKEIISQYPKILLIIRLAAGMSQREFSRNMGITRSALAHVELGISKTMKKNNAELLAIKINKMKNPKFTEKNIFDNYENLWHQAQYGQSPDKLRNYGRSAFKTRKPNESEKYIAKILQKTKISYQREAMLHINGIPFFFDFIIPKSQDPKYIIECKKIASTKNHNFRVISYRISYEVGYKFHLLKEKYPNIKTVLILESDIDKIPERVIKIFDKEIDHFFYNCKKSEISNFFSKLNHPRSG